MTMAITHRLRRAAAIAATGFVAVSAFQVLLVAGIPLGRAAWGGATAELPTTLRIASGVATVFWLVAAMVVLRRGGYRVRWVPERVAKVGTWALTGLLMAGVLMNLASSSPWERFGWAPMVAALAALCLAVARGHRPASH
jgi:peptidoglycan/LPS O-acetylase OafA/YrhL